MSVAFDLGAAQIVTLNAFDQDCELFPVAFRLGYWQVFLASVAFAWPEQGVANASGLSARVSRVALASLIGGSLMLIGGYYLIVDAIRWPPL